MRWAQADRLWKKWHEAVASGRTPDEFLVDVSDESLIQLLLACPEGQERARDTVATHLWNRLRWSRRTIDELTTEITDRVRHTTDVLGKAAPVIHRLERAGIQEADPEREDPAPRPMELNAHDASLMIEAVKSAHADAQDVLRRLEAFAEKRVDLGRPEDVEDL